MKIPPLAAALLLTAACAHHPPAPAAPAAPPPVAAAPAPAPVPPPPAPVPAAPPHAVQPAGLKLPPEPGDAVTAAQLVKALDARADRMASLYRISGNANEELWRDEALAAEAAKIRRALARYDALRAAKGAAFDAKPEQNACYGFHIFPVYGYSGPEGKKKLPFLRTLEILLTAKVASLEVAAACGKDAKALPENRKRLVSLRADIASLSAK